MNPHLSKDLAGRWAADLLDEEQARAVEAHAAECGACEALLQSEARAEQLLAAVVRRIPAPTPSALSGATPLLRRALTVGGATLALAATVALVVVSPWRSQPSAPPLPEPQPPVYEAKVSLPPESVISLAPFPFEPPRYEGDQVRAAGPLFTSFVQ